MNPEVLLHALCAFLDGGFHFLSPRRMGNRQWFGRSEYILFERRSRGIKNARGVGTGAPGQYEASPQIRRM